MSNEKKPAERRSFGKHDEVRKSHKGSLELVTIDGATIGRAVFKQAALPNH